MKVVTTQWTENDIDGPSRFTAGSFLVNPFVSQYCICSSHVTNRVSSLVVNAVVSKSYRRWHNFAVLVDAYF